MFLERAICDSLGLKQQLFVVDSFRMYGISIAFLQSWTLPSEATAAVPERRQDNKRAALRLFSFFINILAFISGAAHTLKAVEKNEFSFEIWLGQANYNKNPPVIIQSQSSVGTDSYNGVLLGQTN